MSPRGRRPIPREIQLNPQTNGVQDSVDGIALTLLDELKTAIKKRIEAGDLKSLTLLSLTKELRGLLHAIKKPASTLNYMNAPQIPQLPSNQTIRERALKAGAEVNTDVLLESQKHFLDLHGDTPAG